MVTRRSKSAKQVKDLIERFGKAVDSEWRRRNYDASKFPRIAKALAKSMLPSDIYSPELALEILDDPYISQVQTPSLFSDLNVKLFDNGRLYIELLNWTDSDTAIHDHNFAGVQVQLLGESLNVTYEFQQTECLAENFSLGSFSIHEVEILRPGDTCEIPPGHEYKHAVFHVSIPTISMIVRTHGLPEYSPQRTYFPPSVQADFGVIDTLFNKRLRAIRLLEQIEPDRISEYILKLADTYDIQRKFWLLTEGSDLVFSNKTFEKLYRGLISRGTNRRWLDAIVGASAHTKFVSDLLHRVKPHLQARSDRLLVSSMCSAFDVESFAKIARAIGLIRLHPYELRTHAVEISAKLPSDDAEVFLRASRRLGCVRDCV